MSNHGRAPMMISKWIVTFSVLATACCLHAAESEGRAGDAQGLLAAYQTAMKSVDRSSMSLHYSVRSSRLPDWRGEVRAVQYRDGDRFSSKATTGTFNSSGPIPGESQYRYNLYTETVAIQARGAVNLSELHATWAAPKNALRKYEQNTSTGSFLEGKVFGCGLNTVAEMLQLAENLQVSPDTETVGETECYVLSGDTTYGRVRAWIAPSRGYYALRYEISKTATDLFDDAPVGDQGVERGIMTLDDVQVEKIDGAWVATSGTLSQETILSDGKTIRSEERAVRTEIDLDPDFDAVKAFEIDLPEGTPVTLDEFPGIRYQWREGKLTPVVDDAAICQIDAAVDNSRREVADDSERGNGETAEALPTEPSGEGEQRPARSASSRVAIAVGVLIVACVAGFVWYSRRKRSDAPGD